MKQKLYFDILETLSKKGIGEDVDITHCFNNYLLQAKEPGDMLFGGERVHKIREYLDTIVSNKHLTYKDLSPSHNQELTEEEKERNKKEPKSYKWVKPISITAQITNSGLDYYYAYLLKNATLRSFKNQFLYNLITWGIALLAVGTTIYTTFHDTDLNKKLMDLEKKVQQLKLSQTLIPATHNTIVKK